MYIKQLIRFGVMKTTPMRANRADCFCRGTQSIKLFFGQPYGNTVVKKTADVIPFSNKNMKMTDRRPKILTLLKSGKVN